MHQIQKGRLHARMAHFNRKFEFKINTGPPHLPPVYGIEPVSIDFITFVR